MDWATLVLKILASQGGSDALHALFKDHGIEDAALQKIADGLPDFPAPNEKKADS